METFSDRTPKGRRTKAALNAALDGHFSRQAGLISTQQLRDERLSSRAITKRIDSGELVPRTDPPRRPNRNPSTKRGRSLPARGVYSKDSGPLTLDQLRWRAVLAAPQGAGIGSISGCAMHDLIRPSGSHLHVVYEGSGWRPPSGVTGHGVDELTDRDLTRIRGIACCSVGRSLFDAAADVDAETLDDVLDRAVRLRVYDERYLTEWLARFKHRPAGNAELRAAIARLDEKSGEFVTTFERRVTRLMQTSRRLRMPIVVNVLAEGYKPDIHPVGTRAIIECDGADYHRSLAQIVADEEREAILLARGYRILRIRWSQLRYEPDRTLERIERFVLANLEPPARGR